MCVPRLELKPERETSRSVGLYLFSVKCFIIYNAVVYIYYNYASHRSVTNIFLLIIILINNYQYIHI